MLFVRHGDGKEGENASLRVKARVSAICVYEERVAQGR